jgi:glycine cleavage system aminomethyltransferase T
MFGHTLGATVVLGWVERPDGPATDEWLREGTYEVEIAWERVPAELHLRPAYDPSGARLRA